jgi:hypothetical protein
MIDIKENFQVEILPGCPDEHKQLLADYWAMDEHGEFLNKRDKLLEGQDLSISELAHLLASHTKATFIKGFCKGCGQEIKEEATSQTGIKTIISEAKREHRYSELICEDCLQERIKAEQEETRKIREEMMERERALELEKEEKRRITYEFLKASLANRKWEQLTEDDSELLHLIARKRNKKDIFAEAFRKSKYGSAENYAIWRSFKNLEKAGLIWIEREEDKTIEHIHMLDELRELILLRFFEDIPSGVDTPTLAAENFDKLRITLRRNKYRQKIQHPYFSGQIKLTRDFLLKEGETYRYAGWVRDDGSLAVNIEPASKLLQDAKEVFEERLPNPSRPSEIMGQEYHSRGSSEANSEDDENKDFFGSHFDSEAPF